MLTQKDDTIILSSVYSSLAQLVEHAAVNRRVVGSSPTGGAKRDCQSAVFFYAKTHFKAAFCSVTFYTSRQSRPKVSERMAEASRSHSAALFYCRAASQRGYPKGADRDFRSPLLFEQCALRPRRSPDFTQKNRKSSSCYQPCVS